jgi:hypothetical protein
LVRIQSLGSSICCGEQVVYPFISLLLYSGAWVTSSYAAVDKTVPEKKELAGRNLFFIPSKITPEPAAGKVSRRLRRRIRMAWNRLLVLLRVEIPGLDRSAF